MLDPKTYAEFSYAMALDYADQVEREEIPANKWIKLAVYRFREDLEREDLVQDPDAVKLVYKFFSLVNIQIKDRYTQFELIPYQAFIILNLFLFYYRESGKRRFNHLYLFIPRKNGKTVFAVVLNLYFLILDGVVDPQSLLLASTREQATIALDYAKSIVLNSPAIKKRVRPMQYEIRFNYGGSRGFMKPVPTIDPKRLDGYSPSCAILDEVHTYEDGSLYEVVSSGTGARRNPMVLMITTAGTSVESFAFTMLENCKGILRGEVEDDTMLTFLYTPDEEDKYEDRIAWRKSNPALGYILDMDYLEDEYKKATNMTSLLPNFLTKHLNIFTGSAEVWIPEKILERTKTPFNLEDFEGEDIYLGLDLSSTRDLTSLVGIFEREGYYYATSWFWLPNQSEKMFRKGGLSLKHWIQEGYIKHCQTETIDYDLIYEKIEEVNKRFNIVALGYDPYNSDLIIPRLNELGVTSYRFEQTAKAFNFPLKYLEKMIYERKMSLQGNPVLLWNFRNVVLYVDGNNNIKIMKNKSADSVDGAVSLGMALGGWLAYNLDSERMNIAAYLTFNANAEEVD